MRSELLEKRIEEIRKRKKKLLEDIKLIDNALNGLDKLEDFVKDFKVPPDRLGFTYCMYFINTHSALH